uniref:Uncharacterized protein n=1 Tax=Anopheles epiroticus TaxID=199890 RepID=A0A182PQL6_9DIPT
MKTHRVRTSQINEQEADMSSLDIVLIEDDYDKTGVRASDDGNDLQELYDQGATAPEVNVVPSTGSGPSEVPPPEEGFNFVTSSDFHESKALELALAAEEELNPQWIDISMLQTKPLAALDPVTSACVALPTNVPSYVDLSFNVNVADYLPSTEANVVTSTEGPVLANNLSSEGSSQVFTIENYFDENLLESANATVQIDRAIQNSEQRAGGVKQEEQEETEKLINELFAGEFLPKLNPSSDVVQEQGTDGGNGGSELPGSGGFVPVSQMENLKNESNNSMLQNAPVAVVDGSTKTLKDITADADICRCVNCQCDPMQGCIGGCGPENPCRATTGANTGYTTPASMLIQNLPQSIDQQLPPLQATSTLQPESSVTENGSLLVMQQQPQQQPQQQQQPGPMRPPQLQSSCCKSSPASDNGPKLTDQLEPLTNMLKILQNCSCAGPRDDHSKGCCVVICLKTLETLKKVLSTHSSMIQCRSSNSASAIIN